MGGKQVSEPRDRWIELGNPENRVIPVVLDGFMVQNPCKDDLQGASQEL